MSNVLEINNLSVDIKLDNGLLTPVRNISLTIGEEETLGLVGESGCGKSLTSKSILGINNNNCLRSGEILFTNETGDTVDLLKYNRKSKALRKLRGKSISMIFQEPMTSFSPFFTVGKQVLETVRLHITKDKKKAEKIAVEMMERVGIADAKKRFEQFPHEYSGGMLQRALIASSLVCNPRILIADEPTTALDVTIQAQILDLMKDLQKQYKMSILFITHDLGIVAQMCDRVAVMYLGKIVEHASVKELFNNPLHPYTKGLIGSVHSIGKDKVELETIAGTVPLAINLPDRCGFYDRCNSCMESLCKGINPELKEIQPGHFVACYLFQNKEESHE